MGDKYLDLSVVIITHNEEDNIRRCLHSLPKGVEIIVLDSNSKDKTQEIASSFGAKVYENSFTNFAEQKNLACSYATRNWILSLDADELLDIKLQNELERIVSQSDFDGNVIGMQIKRRLVFMGRVMRFGKTTDYPLRLFRRGCAKFVGRIHESLDIPNSSQGRVKKGVIFHYSYKDLSDYFYRFNRYTTEIARKKLESNSRKPFLVHIFRPWVEFVSRYIFRLGFLDGYVGYTYALISSLYTYVKYAKLEELIQGKENYYE